MKNRKKWWAIGLTNYGRYVRLYFFLTLSLLIFGSNIVIVALNNLPKIDVMFFSSILVLIALVFSFSQFVSRAKEEYQNKDLGFMEDK